MMRLQHPNIIPLLDFGVEENVPFLVMEYAPNGTLHQRHPLGVRLPLDLVCSYVDQVAAALQYAHEQRLIHRDIKPQNMLLGHKQQILLADFGIAAIAQSESSLSTQEMAGTISYMAPEQFRGKPRPASDQYALAICVYQWLSGERPFQGTQWEIVSQHLAALPPPLRQKVPNLPQKVEEVLMKGLAKEPDERFVDIRTFAIALSRASHLNTQQPDATAPHHLLPFKSDQHSPMVPPSLPHIYSASQPSHKEIVMVKSQPTMEKPPSSFPPLKVPLAPIDLTQSALNSHRIMPLPQIPLAPGSPPLGIAASFSPAIPHRRSKRKTLLIVGLMLSLLIISGFLFPRLITSYTRPMQRTPLRSFSFSKGATIASSPIVANGLVYVGVTGGLYAFDATCRKQCQPLWSFSMGTFNTNTYFSPKVANGLVYVGDNYGDIYAFDTTCHKQCQPLWSFSIGSFIISSPTAANGLVYVGDDVFNRFYAFGIPL